MKKYIYIVSSLVLGFLLSYWVMSQFNARKVTNDSHAIAYEIKRLNKMIVAEQAYSDIYSHKNSLSFPGFERFMSFDKKVLLLVNAKVQATYDLSKLKVEVDAEKKKITLYEIPPLEVQIYPDVQFYDMEQSTFNSFSKDELNEVKNNAIKKIEQVVDRSKLEKEAREQLLDNLLNLYFLADAYQWEIDDRTPYADELEGMFH